MAAMAAKPTFETRYHYWRDDKVKDCPFTVGYDYGRFTNNVIYSWPTEDLAQLFVKVASTDGRAAAFAACQAEWERSK